MLISFYATLAGVTANLVKDEAKLTVSCKVEDMDDDVIDDLAGLVNAMTPLDVSLSAQNGGHHEIALPCTVAGVVTDHAKRLVKITLGIPEKRILAEDKSYLELWYRMEDEVAVEVSSRQMSFKDLTPRASRREMFAVETNATAGFDDDEELINKAIEVVRQSQRASVSAIQRQLRIGYTRAARLMDQLEERGIVGPMQNGEREVLPAQFDSDIDCTTKVTVKIGGQEFDLDTVRAGIGEIKRRKALAADPDTGEVIE